MSEQIGQNPKEGMSEKDLEMMGLKEKEGEDNADAKPDDEVAESPEEISERLFHEDTKRMRKEQLEENLF